MSNYEDVYAPDLTEETESTLSGSEQFVMFDSVEGKRALLSTIANYIAQHGEINGDDIPTIIAAVEAKIGTLSSLDTTTKTNLVAAINEVVSDLSDVKEDLSDVPTETTGQALLREEEQNTVYEQYVLDTLSRIFDGLPTDETAEDIVAELVEENSWLDQLTREIITE